LLDEVPGSRPPRIIGKRPADDTASPPLKPPQN
jgi:hypothetical protein